MGDTSKSDAPRAQPPAPPNKNVGDYAQTCVQYVLASTGVPLDYSTDTLPLLDHYLRDARHAIADRPESEPLVATVAGCYLGEVMRARHALVWDLQAEDPLDWRVTNPQGNVAVMPVAIARAALAGPGSRLNLEVFSLEPSLRRALGDRLDLLPEVDEEDFLAPSTRVEVLDIAMDLLTGSKQIEHDEPDTCACKS